MTAAPNATTPPPPTQAEQPNVAIRTRPPSPKRLSRKVLMGAALIGAALVTFALMNGLSNNRTRSGEGVEQEAVAASGGPPESIARASSQYRSGDLPRGQADLAEEMGEGEELAPPQDPMWRDAAPPHVGRGAGESSASSAPPPPSPKEIARASPILFDTEADGARTGAGDPGDDDRLDARLTPPRSRYEIQAGHVIPAALVTAINSDLSGRVIAQVTAPVYDSVSGDHLLIPQGARLIGAYENGVRYGARRILLVWNRLILPNGWSINLSEMPATDGAGAAGLQDRTDNHLDRLASAIGLSAIISVIANESEDGDTLGDVAAQQAADTGGRIVDRDLEVRPTLRIRAGAPVRVLVTRDIELRPYVGPTQMRR